MQHIALIQTHSPYNSANAREALDLILALAAVEHHVSVVFTEDAVYQLLPSNHSSPVLKTFQKSFGLFGLYDIENCLVCADSLARRGLSELTLPSGFTLANQQQINHLLATANQLIRC